MTTIAYRDGVLAADSAEEENKLILPGRVHKIIRLDDGTLYAYAGLVWRGLQLRDHLQGTRVECPEWDEDDTIGIRVLPDGTLWNYDGRVWIRRPGDYNAYGSGREFALGAMARGASAKEAVEIACEFDCYSRTPVYVESVTNPPKKRRRRNVATQVQPAAQLGAEGAGADGSADRAS